MALLAEFSKLEENKKEILNFLNAQDPSDLTRSEEGSWCMIQAIRHIQISEDSILTYLEKKIQQGDEMPERTFIGRISLVIFFFAFSLKFKFKAPEAVRNPPITSLDELANDWELTREKIKSFITTYPEKWEQKAIYRHPVGFRITLTNTIKFLNVHLRHHIHQINRIKSSLGS